MSGAYLPETEIGIKTITEDCCTSDTPSKGRRSQVQQSVCLIDPFDFQVLDLVG